jgi:hypothetical protein
VVDWLEEHAARTPIAPHSASRGLKK